MNKGTSINKSKIRSGSTSVSIRIVGRGPNLAPLFGVWAVAVVRGKLYQCEVYLECELAAEQLAAVFLGQVDTIVETWRAQRKANDRFTEVVAA